MTNTKPYSNADMNRFRDEIASRIEPNPIVEMDFSRVQVSIDDAFQRGWENHREYAADMRMKFKRDRWKLVAVLAVIFLGLWGCLAVLYAIRLSPDPNTVPHISAE